VLSDNGLGRRTHALLELRAGQAEAALRSLKEAVELKKTPADAWYFLGELLFAGGDPTGAAEAWEATIRRARRKRDWFALRARAALGSEEGGESHEPS
jgi:predicted Zn-dependent protease